MNIAWPTPPVAAHQTRHRAQAQGRASDGTRLRQLATDHAISRKTAYRYLHEGIDLLAAHAPDLHQTLDEAKAAGLTHINLDGIVITTDRVATPGPNGADVWWSGKHQRR
ncbi:hypothetical protein ITP53_20775 [Nonomuraea sp. K274]|uniref:Uncharacterized protein n=1 Tax=Nonomuraea cypriaca TaxID=1187855 RepID=A0A931F227_9ACTN|nr:hypothetical protein [Nonomuraea cypriaca]